MCWDVYGRGSSKTVPSSYCAKRGWQKRMDAEGLVHHGVEFLFEGQRVPVPLSELTDGKA